MNTQDEGAESDPTEAGMASRVMGISGAILLLIAVITMFVY